MQRLLSTEADLCFVRIVTARPGGTFTYAEDMRFGSLRSAVETCDRLQKEIDADAEPRRAYVLGPDRIPIWAGGARGSSPVAASALSGHIRNTALAGR
jgi:hypothetical protein